MRSSSCASWVYPVAHLGDTCTDIKKSVVLRSVLRSVSAPQQDMCPRAFAGLLYGERYANVGPFKLGVIAKARIG